MALRPIGEFAPRQASVFEDPGDEKSWHRSQRSEELKRFYEGRDASWYASAVRPLRGARRVIDLGCGPGLTLEALLAQGAADVLGVDRWPAFTRTASSGAPIILHDLTLPMPFLSSGSFNAVLSHYALDYVSPIGTRQVLREAHRILAPEGQLLLYVVGIGLGGGDETRTVPYSPAAMSMMLEEAGFADLHVEASPNGRQTVARARRPARGSLGAAEDAVFIGPGEVGAPIAGETQLSAGLEDVVDRRAEIELSGEGRNVTLSLDLSENSEQELPRIAVCARVVLAGSHGVELQAWSWSGTTPVALECVRLEFMPTSVRLRCRARVEHAALWAPVPLHVEPPADAHVRETDLPVGAELSEAERGAEGRRVIVESRALAPAETAALLEPGRNRFLIRRPETGAVVPTLDTEWLAGRIHGIVLSVNELTDPARQALTLWAGLRQALLFIEGNEWGDIHRVVSACLEDLHCPVVLVDPVLTCDAMPRPLPAEVARAAISAGQVFVLLAGATRDQSDEGELAPLRGRVLHGGRSQPRDATAIAEATESLRYLTERTLLMRLRREHRRPLADLGRRPSLSW
jgi:SAM-dependent methyltransferase